MANAPRNMVTKTYIAYEELDLYNSYPAVAEVVSRDPASLVHNKEVPDYALTRPFHFFDADITFFPDDTMEIGPRYNESSPFIVAATVMTLKDYKAREAPKLERYKKEKTGFLGRAISTFLDGGFSLRAAFRDAVIGRPVMAWYISAVKSLVAEAEKNNITHICLQDNDPRTLPVLVTPDLTVLDQRFAPLFPASQKRPHTPQKKP